MAAIMDLPFTPDLLSHAVESEQDKNAWELWVQLYPHMATETIQWKGFEQFKQEMFQVKPQASKKSADEIENEMMRLVTAYENQSTL